MCVHVLSRVSLTGDPMDYSLPDFPVHGILQARILERVTMPSSRESFPPRNPTCIQLHWQAVSLSLAPHGKPIQHYYLILGK